MTPEEAIETVISAARNYAEKLAEDAEATEIWEAIENLRQTSFIGGHHDRTTK